MWQKLGTKSDLLDILVNTPNLFGAIESAERLSSLEPKGENLLMIWADANEFQPRLPDMIVLPENQNKYEFLAWSLTYLAEFYPITAFSRILDWREYSEMAALMQTPNLGILENALVGAVLMEGLMRDRTSSKKNIPSITSCLAASTFALSRSMALKLPHTAIHIVFKNWERLQRLTSAPRANNTESETWRIWQTIADSVQARKGGKVPDGLIHDAIGDMIHRGHVRIEILRAILGDGVDFFQFDLSMKDSQEQRVSYLESLIARIPRGFAKMDLEAAFAIAYIASLIQPGSLNHFEILSRFTISNPAVLIWYGVCAGLHRVNEVQRVFSALGMRIRKKLMEPHPFFWGPDCDISIDELEIILKSENQSSSMRNRVRDYRAIELMPLVTVQAVWSTDRPGTVPLRYDSEYSQLQEEQDRLLLELGKNLEKVMSSYRRIRSEKDRHKY